jgi:hypothetical protein
MGRAGERHLATGCGGSLRGVDLRRLRRFDVLAGLFGAALVGLLWAPWFSVPQLALVGAVTRSFGSVHVSAWQAMSVNDVILCIAGGLGIWLLVATVSYSTGAVPIAAAAFATFAGVLASLLALIRLIWPPDLGPGPTDRAAGVWLGTAAAIGLAVSAVASMRDERQVSCAQVPITDLPAPRVEGSGA